MSTATTTVKSKPAPAHRIRVHGVTATIWRNESDNGVWFNTTVVRSFKNDQDEYQDTNSYGEEQLLVLSKVADMAHSWIIEQQAQERAAQRNGERF